MELTFLGTGNAFAPTRYWSAFLVDDRYLFDAPPTLLPHMNRLGKDILWDATGREPDAAVAKEFQSYLDRRPAGWSIDESQIRDWLREHRNQIHREDDGRGR